MVDGNFSLIYRNVAMAAGREGARGGGREHLVTHDIEYIGTTFAALRQALLEKDDAGHHREDSDQKTQNGADDYSEGSG